MFYIDNAERRTNIAKKTKGEIIYEIISNSLADPNNNLDDKLIGDAIQFYNKLVMSNIIQEETLEEYKYRVSTHQRLMKLGEEILDK